MHVNSLTRELKTHQKMLMKVRALDKDLYALKNQPKTDKHVLMTVAQQSLQDSPLKEVITEITQKNDGGISLHFNDVNFDELMRWLIILRDQKGITVNSFEATAVEIQSGYVMADITLRSL